MQYGVHILLKNVDPHGVNSKFTLSVTIAGNGALLVPVEYVRAVPESPVQVSSSETSIENTKDPQWK